MWQWFKEKIRSFAWDQSGVSMVVVALTMPVFLSAAGIAVDLAQGYNIKTRLANALDKAALAAGTTSGDTAAVEAQVLRFVQANYPDGSLGTAFKVKAEVSGKYIRVTASASVPTMFMRLFGYDEIIIEEASEVIRELSGVEVVLVLDVTGSMAGNNIAALKLASTKFLQIMFDRISDPQYIRIGLVPFSNSVNVGAYGLNDGFVSRPATDPYISPASNIAYSAATTTTVTTSWKGCITERAYPADTRDAPTPNWGMYRYPRECTSMRNGSCQSWRNDPNYSCPNSRIVPLTSSRTTLQNTINALPTVGNTYGNVGMVWGWRVISPGAPFTQGTTYNDPEWSKIVIMMTDGDNTMHPTYSVYGNTASHSIDADDLDDRFEETCTNMKNAGVTLYTITFQSAITNATRQIFRRCATTPEYYYNAPTNNDLQAAFEQIANQLSQLHISR